MVLVFSQNNFSDTGRRFTSLYEEIKQGLFPDLINILFWAIFDTRVSNSQSEYISE